MSPLSDIPTLQRVADSALGTTCSVGMAMADGSDAEAGQLIARADAALYRAKDAGRNCVHYDARR